MNINNIEKINCNLRDLKKVNLRPNVFLEVQGENIPCFPIVFLEESNPWTAFFKKNSNFIFLIVPYERNFFERNTVIFYIIEQGGTVPSFIKEIRIANKEYLKEIKLHNKVKEVDFSYCENLESLDLPDSVINLGKKGEYSDFHGCRNLKSIKLPSKSKFNEIPFEFFSGCESLQSIDIPKNVKSIERSAFRDCFSLKEVVIPKNCVKIGWNAFVNCKKLEKVELPDGLEIIDWNAFENCTSLKEVKIPNSIKKIAKCAFKGCSNITLVAPDFVDTQAVMRSEQWERK